MRTAAETRNWRFSVRNCTSYTAAVYIYGPTMDMLGSPIFIIDNILYSLDYLLFGYFRPRRVLIIFIYSVSFDLCFMLTQRNMWTYVCTIIKNSKAYQYFHSVFMLKRPRSYVCAKLENIIDNAVTRIYVLPQVYLVLGGVFCSFCFALCRKLLDADVELYIYMHVLYIHICTPLCAEI